ncbi:ribonuclease H family protein [Vibrio methylphosphonaticus]|uniref:ribonuclease H family protein n=1 Tax=Vibrio methylphosphonaticus TaxID=2946866 RepID=UPI00202A5955|nr:ribonuclease H family protein [Vibrio methylphosphonaticus]MCL9776293.1 ribonuclease H family protein [Vibrio methylphosphonaticus]
MAKKYYVVWKGRETGIFTTWADCKAQVDKFTGAKFKSFQTLAEAEQAFGSNGATGNSTTRARATAAKTNTKAKAKPLSQQDIVAMPVEVKIFTDGACDPNPGQAGTGLAVYQHNTLVELWYGKYQANGTNNTAELNGLHQSMLLAKAHLLAGRSVAIYCDSMYSIQCITTWAKGWEAKGWKKSGGEIKNLDLIKPMFELYQQIANQVAIHHVNGHVGIEGNELADRMSIVAVDTKQEVMAQYSDLSDLTKILALRAG